VGALVIRWLQRPDLRDRFLIAFGALGVVLGYGYGVAVVPRGVRNPLSTGLNILPLWAYACMWAAAGLYCIMAGFTRRGVGGFIVGSFMCTLWGLIYLIGWIHGDPGRGWVSAALFGCLAYAVFSVSGCVDPTPIVDILPPLDPDGEAS
jgi:hypothetical protein